MSPAVCCTSSPRNALAVTGWPELCSTSTTPFTHALTATLYIALWYAMLTAERTIQLHGLVVRRESKEPLPRGTRCYWSGQRNCASSHNSSRPPHDRHGAPRWVSSHTQAISQNKHVQVRQLFSLSSWQRWLGRWNLNAQERGLYFCQSGLNHSCVPNVAVLHLDEGGEQSKGSAGGTDGPQCAALRLRVASLCALAADDQLLHCYVDPDMSDAERARRLWQAYGFACTCPRCRGAALDEGAQQQLARFCAWRTLTDSGAHASSSNLTVVAASEREF